MRRSKSIYVLATQLVVLILAVCSCQKQEKTQDEDTTLFTISHQEELQILKVSQPWKGAKTEKEYVLSAAESTQKHIKTPIKRVVSVTSAATAFMEELGVLHTLVGVDNANYLAQTSLQAKCDIGEIDEVGSIDNLNIEKIIALQPDVLFTYASRENPQLAQLEKLSIPVVYISEYLESSPLQRAEWIKFVATFFDLESKADSIYKSVERDYNALLDRSKNTDSTTVLLSRDFGGNWYLSGGKSFAAKMIKDAGGKYLFSHIKEEGSVPISFEKVLTQASEADVWLCNSLGWNSLDVIQKENELYKSLKAYQSKQVYNNDKRQNKRGGNDYFSSAIVHPEYLLKDYITIFQHTNDSLYYFRKLE